MGRAAGSYLLEISLVDLFSTTSVCGITYASKLSTKSERAGFGFTSEEGRVIRRFFEGRTGSIVRIRSYR